MIKVGFERPLRTVVCMGAHPDDIEVGSAGLLSSLAEGHPEATFIFAIATADRPREEEGVASAVRLLGERVRMEFGGMRDSFVPYSHAAEAKEFFRSAVGSTEPDLVIAPHLGDRHQDHRFVADLAHQIFRGPMILEYEIIKLDGDLGSPGVYFPLSAAQADAKLTHLEGHFASQHHKVWYSRDTLAGLMRVRGVECGAPEGYAEAFHARRISLA